MNDKQAKALGLRAVACPGWRWLPGMLARWDRPPGAGGQQVFPTEARVADLPMGPLSLMFCLVDPASVYRGSWPDFRDAATLGCLLALVREVWADPFMGISVMDVQTSSVTRSIDPVWNMIAGPGRTRSEPMGPLHRMTMAQHRTEIEAMVAALEAAPGRARHESENA